MKFKDRHDAAAQLIPFLNKYKGNKCVILAVPRGGVPLGHFLAKHFNFPLELLMIKKIGHPANPEFAVGAVSLEDYIIDEQQNIPQNYITEQVKKIRDNLTERYQKFKGNLKPQELTDKIVIIVDDGVATGNTILSSIKMLRRQNPASIVVAVPVAPGFTAEKMKREVEEFICPYIPKIFISVGNHYYDFSDVTDEEVIRLIKDLDYSKIENDFTDENHPVK